MRCSAPFSSTTHSNFFVFSTLGPIGIFDSGYGGLTILSAIRQRLPQYDYLYLGDNARAPYGSRSFDVVYEFTRQAVERLFSMGCHLVVLGCNTASAKALRTIQQNDLPRWGGDRRVLGIIRPTAEAIGTITQSRHIGILATEGTVRSQSYNLEIQKLFPDLTVTGQACPLWAAIVEAGEAGSPGADYFIEKRIRELLQADPLIDSIILGCTHYPLLFDSIRRHTPPHIRIVSQGQYVADRLADYLLRHAALEASCTKGAAIRFLTTENSDIFRQSAQRFLGQPIDAVESITLGATGNA